jgi:hypothetical protein
MKRSEHIYEVYFYSSPIFLILQDDEIVDVNITNFDREPNYKFSKRKYGPDKEEYYLDIIYNDSFFYYNFDVSKKDEFLVIIQTFSKSTGFFIQQIQVQGDVMESGRKDGNNYIRLVFDQMLTNDLGNLPQKFTPATVVYKQERASYFRDKKIDALLNKDK